MLPKVIILDFDGLILDTESSLREAWRAEYARHGLSLDEHAYRELVGQVGAREALLAGLPGGTADPAAVLARVHPRHRDTVQRMPAMPGVAAIMARRGQVRLAVASSSPSSWVEPQLRRLGLWEALEVVVCRDMVTRPKPSPEVYLEALARLGVAPAEAVALEDSLVGVLAAVAAGIRCLAVPGPVTRGSAFPGAEAVLGSLAEADQLLYGSALAATAGGLSD
ncbi:HAD family hydrolase [Crossiella sp. NPDC003009]